MNQISTDKNNTQKFNIEYLNKKEASFLLGKLKFVECTNCPDFYDGCTGNVSQHEIASMADQQYLCVHTRGTEKYLCGKLRNIINLCIAEEQEISNQFESKFNTKISMLSRKGNKAVLVNDVDEFENIISNMKQHMVSEFESRANKINLSNRQTFEELSQRLEYAETRMFEQEQELKAALGKRKRKQ